MKVKMVGGPLNGKTANLPKIMHGITLQDDNPDQNGQVLTHKYELQRFQKNQGWRLQYMGCTMENPAEGHPALQSIAKGN